MFKKIFISLIVIASIAKQIQAQIITTVCGNGTAGYSGDGSQATIAELDSPWELAFDIIGNYYFVDGANNVIRKVNTFGVIKTIAGNGTNGFSGDGGQATNAEFNEVIGVVVDATGNIYIADQLNNRIRKVNSNGIITTFVGNGTSGYSGDGGQASAAELNQPDALLIDASGNLYIADSFNGRIRRVSTSGIITTVAGNGTIGFSGDGGLAINAELSNPTALALDAFGNLFIADDGNLNIRKVSSSGLITTIAGNGTYGYSGDGGQATAAEFSYPTGIAIDAVGNLYIADRNNLVIRKINTSGIINTIVGNGVLGFSGDGGLAINAELNYPNGVTIDSHDNLYIADFQNQRIRKVTNIAAAGIEQIANINEQVNIYPNPASNSLQVSFSGNIENGTLVITDMLGNTVQQFPFNTQHLTLNIADLGEGVYNVSISSNAGVINKRVVVVR